MDDDVCRLEMIMLQMEEEECVVREVEMEKVNRHNTRLFY
jgi:hypothetical protein